ELGRAPRRPADGRGGMRHAAARHVSGRAGCELPPPDQGEAPAASQAALDAQTVQRRAGEPVVPGQAPCAGAQRGRRGLRAYPEGVGPAAGPAAGGRRRRTRYATAPAIASAATTATTM